MAQFVHKSLSVAALLLQGSLLSAQATAAAKPSCDVAEASKGNAARATLSVNLAREGAAPAVATSNLKSAVKLVEKVDKGDDATANAYVLGTALSVWANQPGVGLSPKRGTLGFTTNPEGTVDIPTTLDSLFTIVETAKPLCSDYTAYWRAGQKFYLDVVNGAINSLNQDKVDSAEYYATAANRLYGKSPYGVMVLGNVASKRNDNAKAVEYWAKAAEIANRDTSYRDVRRQMLSNLGMAYTTTATTATGAERLAAAKKVEEVYSEMMAMPGGRPSSISAARQGIQNTYLLVGDTASAVKSWQPLIANPAAYDYLDLLNSAVSASRANRIADAGKLFEATLAQNPYSRDALYNVAITYLTAEQNDKVGPIVKRLIDVDPSNPENYNLAARAYLSLAKTAQTAKNAKLAAAYNDTTVTWYGTGNKLPVEVTFREFSPGEKQAALSGTVLDRRDRADENTETAKPAASAKAVKGKPAAKTPVAAAKTYPPKAYTITFEALDKTGTVLGTSTTTTDALTPGNSARFTVTIPSTNAVAYRYKVAE